MASAPAQQAPAPGQLFEVPGAAGGGTQWQDQYESTEDLAVTLNQTNPVTVNGIQKFKQVDVVTDWDLHVAITQTYTAGTSTLTNSAYAPFNQLGSFKLKIQNQYSSVDVENGIDLYIFNLLRPRTKSDRRNLLYANPAGSPAGGTAGDGYYTAALAQPNLVVPAQWTNALAGYGAVLRIPAAQWFDVYWDLDVSGNPVSPPHRALVSPQFMAGTTREITPKMVFNAMSSGQLDTAPVNIGAGTGTATGSATLSFRRKAIYAANPAVMPVEYAWQYRWVTDRRQIAGQSKMPLLLPIDAGQVLSIYVRLWDPDANGGLGAPIALSNVTKVQLQYGSGLLRFDGTPLELQKEFFAKHGFLLPEGVMCFDLALDENDRITNARALNMLTTAGCQVYFETSAPVSAAAYAVLGIESLVYVS